MPVEIERNGEQGEQKQDRSSVLLAIDKCIETVTSSRGRIDLLTSETSRARGIETISTPLGKYSKDEVMSALEYFVVADAKLKELPKLEKLTKNVEPKKESYRQIKDRRWSVKSPKLGNFFFGIEFIFDTNGVNERSHAYYVRGPETKVEQILKGASSLINKVKGRLPVKA